MTSALAGRETALSSSQARSYHELGYLVLRSVFARPGRWRQLFYLSYYAAPDGGDRHDEHYNELLAWLKKKYAQYSKIDVYFA